MISPAEYRRRAAVNEPEISQWMWMARHAIRKRRPKAALEAMSAALWLMGATKEPR